MSGNRPRIEAETSSNISGAARAALFMLGYGKVLLARARISFVNSDGALPLG